MHCSGFRTERLSVELWDQTKDCSRVQSALESDLQHVLTTSALSPSSHSPQLPQPGFSFETWLDFAGGKGQTLLAYMNAKGPLIGALLLVPSRNHLNVSELHISFLILKKMWGQGLATELVKGLVATGKNGEAMRLVASVDRHNLASFRVLQKSGFYVADELSTDCTQVLIRQVGRTKFTAVNFF